jgi:outer membrane protein
VPIFSGFAVTSRVRESIALEDKARNDLETTRRNAALQARQSFLGVNSGLAQVKALEAAEVSSQSALESNKLGYQVGVRINIDVLNAQRQLYRPAPTWRGALQHHPERPAPEGGRRFAARAASPG